MALSLEPQCEMIPLPVCAQGTDVLLICLCHLMNVFVAVQVYKNIII